MRFLSGVYSSLLEACQAAIFDQHTNPSTPQEASGKGGKRTKPWQRKIIRYPWGNPISLFFSTTKLTFSTYELVWEERERAFYRNAESLAGGKGERKKITRPDIEILFDNYAKIKKPQSLEKSFPLYCLFLESGVFEDITILEERGYLIMISDEKVKIRTAFFKSQNFRPPEFRQGQWYIEKITEKSHCILATGKALYNKAFYNKRFIKTSTSPVSVNSLIASHKEAVH